MNEEYMFKYELGNRVYIKNFNREFLIDLCSYLSFKYFLNLEDISEWLEEYDAVLID